MADYDVVQTAYYIPNTFREYECVERDGGLKFDYEFADKDTDRDRADYILYSSMPWLKTEPLVYGRIENETQWYPQTTASDGTSLREQMDARIREVARDEVERIQLCRVAD